MTHRKTPLVLLVDDDPGIRDVYSELLIDAGIRCLVASTGPDAIQQARSHPVDLIVMDLKMPGLDGFETTRQLKADRRTRAVPVLAFTGDETADDQARAAGCAGIIRKPCSADVFLAAIREHLAS